MGGHVWSERHVRQGVVHCRGGMHDGGMCGGVCMVGDMHGGGVHGRGVHGRGACMVGTCPVGVACTAGGMHGRRDSLLSQIFQIVNCSCMGVMIKPDRKNDFPSPILFFFLKRENMGTRCWLTFFTHCTVRNGAILVLPIPRRGS